MKEQSTMSESKMLQINKRSFILVCSILIGILVFAYCLTFLLPQGTFVDGVYTEIADAKPLPVWNLFLAPFETLWNESTAATVIVVAAFIAVLGGVFNLIDQTGGIRSIVGYIIQKNQKRKLLLAYEIILIFMLFGSLFGIYEEAVTLLPVIVMLAISLGWDTFTGLCLCLVATGFGFSTAMTNPFSVGLSIDTINATIGTSMRITDGLWFRALIFVFMYVLLCGFVTLHIKKIEKYPTSSPTYESDLQKRQNLRMDEYSVDSKAVLAYGIMFIAIVLITIVAGIIPATSGLTVPIIALSFLIGGIVCAAILGNRFLFILKQLASGAWAMLPAVVMVLLASSIRLLLDKGNVMDTIIHYMIGALENTDPIAAIFLIYAAILVIQFFIGSASAKVVVVVPIIAILVQKLGLSQNLALLAFVFGDGYSDLIYPTNAILMISLGMVSFSYTKWLKKTAWLQAVILVLTAAFLLLGYVIGY